MNDDDALDFPAMQALTGATYRQIDYWTSRGYLRTTTPRSGPVGRHPGSGNWRRWPASEAQVCRAMVAMSRAGMRPVPECARTLASEGHVKVAPGIYLVAAAS